MRSVPPEKETWRLDVYTAAAETSLDITVYDDKNTELTSGDTAAHENYELSLGASEEKEVRVEIKNKDDDSLYTIKALAWRSINDADTVEPITSGWTASNNPKFLSGADIVANRTKGTAGQTISGYEGVYEYNKGTNDVIQLLEWQSYTLALKLAADSTGCTEDNSADPTTTDRFYLQFVDGDWYKGTDLSPKFGYFDDTTDQNDVGVAQNVTWPSNDDSGIVIECTA